MTACDVQGLASPRASGRPSTLHQGRSLHVQSVHTLSLSSTTDIEPEDNPVSLQAQVGTSGRDTSHWIDSIQPTTFIECTRNADVLHANMAQAVVAVVNTAAESLSQ